MSVQSIPASGLRSWTAAQRFALLFGLVYLAVGVAGFAVTGFSCRIGAVKPEPAAFHWCLAELGVDATDVLFVDDRQENVTAAEAVGIRAKLFVGAEDLLDHLDRLDLVAVADVGADADPDPVAAR